MNKISSVISSHLRVYLNAKMSSFSLGYTKETRNENNPSVRCCEVRVKVRVRVRVRVREY